MAGDADDHFDLAIVGGGVVGVQAALTASAAPLNKKICLIDAPRASGMLMNEETGEDLSLGAPTGLFSKALRDTSKTINVASLRGMGLREERYVPGMIPFCLDDDFLCANQAWLQCIFNSVWNEIITNCVELASSNAQDCKRQLEFAGVTYIEGLAAFPDSGGTDSLSVEKPDHSVQIVKADKYMLATGSKPFRPGGIPFDGKRIFDSDSINQVRGYGCAEPTCSALSGTYY